MTALGVFEGTDKGAFDPTGILTREQAAAIICRMLLGDDAENLTTNSTVFSDVAADRWSAGYIGYCAQQKDVYKRQLPPSTLWLWTPLTPSTA